MELADSHFVNTSRHYQVQHAVTNLQRFYDRVHTISKQSYGRGDVIQFGLPRRLAATVMIDHDSADHVDVLIHKQRRSRQQPPQAVHVNEDYVEYLRWCFDEQWHDRPTRALSPLELIEGGFTTEEKTDLFVNYASVAAQGLERQLKSEAISLAPAPDNVITLPIRVTT